MNNAMNSVEILKYLDRAESHDYFLCMMLADVGKDRLKELAEIAKIRSGGLSSVDNSESNI